MELIGRRIQDYRIEALLGEGGMGAVFRAQDVNLLRPVALKVMHGHLARQEEFKRRFLIEAQSAARLEHPGITRIYGFGHEEDLLFMVMEFIAGGSLGRYLRSLQQQQKIVQLQEMLYLQAQVADALDFAHRHNVIHRDLKPDNILLKQRAGLEGPGEPALRALITDFGLAKLLDETEALTATGTLMGTLAYMSPEQVLNRPLDGRSDLYSLGVILYQLATGRLPISITNPSDAVLKHLAGNPPPSPSSVKPELAPPISALIEKAVALNPADRFQRGAELAAALREEAARLTRRDVTRFAPPETVLAFLTELDGEPEAAPDAAPDAALQAGLIFEPFDSEPLGAEALAGADKGGPNIKVSREGFSVQTYPLDKSPLTVGRDPASDIRLEGRGVSRIHARIERAGPGWQGVDLGSTNGTFKDGARLVADVRAEWQPGARLRIGDSRLTLEGLEAAEEVFDAGDVDADVSGTIELDDVVEAPVEPFVAEPFAEPWQPAGEGPVPKPVPAPIAQEKPTPAATPGISQMPPGVIPAAKAAEPAKPSVPESKPGTKAQEAGCALGILASLACCSTVPLPAAMAGVVAGGSATFLVLAGLGLVLSILAGIWAGKRAGGWRKFLIVSSVIVLALNVCVWSAFTFAALTGSL